MPIESGWATVGPFFHAVLPWKGGGEMAKPETKGERISILGRVLDAEGKPITDAMIDKPKRVSTRLGVATQVVYAVAPKVADQIASSIYKLFPEKDPKQKEAETAAKERGEELERRDRKDEVSGEGMALAHLLRGVYF